MTDERLKLVLKHIDINECKTIIDNYIYYCNIPVKQRCYRGDGSFRYAIDECEFLVIADRKEKQAIILRYGYLDLQWHVLRKWRGKHVLSNALRTGIIHKVWPENAKITCCYNYYDDKEEKYSMTKHLADIAGLILE